MMNDTDTSMLFYMTGPEVSSWLNDRTKTKTGVWDVYDWNPHQDSYAQFMFIEPGEKEQAEEEVREFLNICDSAQITMFVAMYKRVSTFSI